MKIVRAILVTNRKNNTNRNVRNTIKKRKKAYDKIKLYNFIIDYDTGGQHSIESNLTLVQLTDIFHSKDIFWLYCQIQDKLNNLEVGSEMIVASSHILVYKIKRVK